MPQSDPATSRAVLIGVGTYQDASLEALPSVVPGMRRLKELLTDHTVWGLRPEHCVVLDDPDTSDEVLRTVCEAARSATDTLLVCFAGHGRLADGGDLCLMLPSAHPDGLFGAVKYRELRRALLTERRADNQVVILDCCYSGAAITGRMGGAEDFAHRAIVERTYLMTACAAQEESYAPPGEPYPAFTGALIDTVVGGIPGGPDPLPMQDVFTHVQKALRARDLPEPKDQATGVGHEIALVRNRLADGRLPALRPPLPPRFPPPLPLPPPLRPPPPLPPPPRSWWVSLAAGLAVVVLVTAAAVVSRNLVADTPPDGPAVGDHRSADPCALVDPTVLGRFGRAEKDAIYGGYERCDVLVERRGGDEIDVMIGFDNGQERPSATGGTTKDGVTVVKLPSESDRCTRELLPDGDDVTVTVTAKTGDSTSAPLCDMADAAAGHASDVLSEGELARRSQTFPKDSLFESDACTLLNATALEAVPGIDANDPDIGFSNWSCEWWSTTSHLQLGVRFDRGMAPTAAEGTPTRIEGRRAFVQPEADGDDMCRVLVVQRTFADDRDRDRTLAETLDVTVRGNADRTTDELCRLTRKLAEAAAVNLPPTR
ncbi:hypothetical protein QF026_005256 [Streptomyces aurantiacus]|uniref:caspase, EACC1-associated type n=1 Tax=Streptomyces aurantiacus TaxID=47760 RepID=UPI00278F0330|nr:caspase family protein [Streptomyces aurantiacus]MDQ0776790.1 hypothetical protein [Streptomyces aurantiacus]